ncbi:MAG: glycosyltransferase family 4 protein, partial [Desulfobulbaceae bacterium]|nr:glycosyltransferase family 4 protein [Desulfobulbaceae bacterium]
KLLFIVNVDWFFISHRLPIALKAMEAGYEVHLLCAVTDKAEYLESLGLIVHPFSFSRSGKNIFNELACVFGLYKQIKSIKPDLVHLVTIKSVLYGGIAARLAKVPGVVSAISGLGFLFVKRAGLQARLLRDAVLFLYRMAMGHPNQRVIFQNPTDIDALVAAGGVQIDKVRMIRGSGVDLQDYPVLPEQDGVPVAVMASRLLKDKGVHEFIEAARIVKSKGIKARFQLIGEPDSGNPESVTIEAVQSWQDEGVVECLGFRSDIAELFAQAHIVTQPSYYGEGLPKVLIEAAACGRAVITTDMPGCRDAVELDVSGLLVSARDAEALAQAMERLIEDDALRQQMGRAGRDLAEREFGIDKVVAAHLAIYQELI